MKRLQVLRVLILAGCFLVLVSGTRTVRAQWPLDQCIKSFYSEWDPACAYCCKTLQDVDDVLSADDTSPGDQSLMTQDVNCGGPVDGGCPVDCGTSTFYVAFTDPYCCGAIGSACTDDSDCCTP